MSSSHVDRRQLFLAAAAAPLVGPAAFGGEATRESSSAPADGITRATLEHAQRLAGLEFTAQELDQVLGGLRRQPRGLDAVRGQGIRNGEAPASVFRPEPRRPLPLSGGSARSLLPSGVPARPPRNEDLAFLPVHALSRMLRARVITSVELTRLCLARLARHDATLHCVITPTNDLALEQARRADEEIAAGRWRGPLHGVPYGLKDLFAVRGHRTTWGAKPFEKQVLDEDAAVYERLRDAGAVLCAKLTLGALAMGDVWFGGKTRNPWNPKQGSSGSSAGSASAVSGGLLPFAIGTETLGSIVSPCTRCGVSGLRPTFGRVSRHGAMALCWKMDKVGPITRDVRDLAIVFDVLHGVDPRDRSTVNAPFRFDSRRPIGEYKIGFVKSAFNGGRGADVEALDVLRNLGAKLEEVELPEIPARELFPILNVEAAAAFDDITRDGRVRDLVAQGRGAWPSSFRSARFYPAVEFLQATRLRQRLVEAWEDLLAPLDALVAPSHRGGVLVPTNFTGHPTVCVPHGLGRDGKSPTSLSFVGRLMGDGPALEVAWHFQRATDWHLRRPPLD